MKKFSQGCTLDCADCCSIDVYAEGNKIIKIEGRKDHPYTKGFICKKGYAHLKFLNNENRLLNPKLKVNGEWRDISFNEAVDIVAEKLSFYKENFGTKSVLYYEQYGSGSLLKSIGDIFCNFYGGVTKMKGGPCWSAGMKAQKYDFGDAKSNSIDEMLNSKSIILWGKNPAYTSIHTAAVLKQAKDKGIEIIVIDPLYTETAKNFATKYIRINPGNDDALAFALIKIIIERDLIDKDYVEKYVIGYENLKSYVDNLDLNKLLEISGVSLDEVNFIIDKYSIKYSSIYIGYGVQKYKNGGNTVRAIDALGAITGQIGYSGGGVNYANKVYPSVLNTDPYNSENFAQNKEIQVSKLAEYLLESNKPIKMALIYKSNLLNQLPDLNRLTKAIRNIEFKVCCDLFMTDTARECDLVIPATNVFESEDLLYSSMQNPYLIYKEKVLEPVNELMDEYYFFRELAKKMNLDNYPNVSKKKYLEKVIKPLKEFNKKITLDYLRENNFTIDEGIAWKSKKFKTKSGKIELYLEEIEKLGLTAIATMLEKQSSNEFPIRLLTVHHRDSLSSQHFLDREDLCQCFINENTAKRFEISNGEVKTLKSKEGEIKTKIMIDSSCGDDVMKIYVGWWKKQSNPNFLTTNISSELGGQLAYNESFVRIE